MSPLFLLDTNIVSAAMADHPKVKAKLSLASGQLITCAIVRGEIRYGLERLPPGKRRTAFESKATSVFATLVSIEPVTQATADVYGTIKRALEIRGISMGDNDLWVAATALSLGATLVTNDHIFSKIPGLAVEDWTK